MINNTNKICVFHVHVILSLVVIRNLLEQSMHSYQIELKGDVLHVGFNRNIPAQGDRIVKDARDSQYQCQRNSHLGISVDNFCDY